MTQLGLAIAFGTVAVLVVEFFRHRRAALPGYGWAAVTGLLIAEWFLFHGFQPVAIYFTPIAWTCYIVLTDAAVLAITGHSRLHDAPAGFCRVALFSIPLWLIFEAYNLRLQNWTYVGVPQPWPQALLGYAWSFATITPGILETADLIEAVGWFHLATPIRFSKMAQSGMIVFGVICLLVPLMVPRPVASRVFVLVWIGFIFLLDPINYRRGLPSLLDELARGQRSRFYSLLISGFVCGWLWEFWNYWAAAKWRYIFPMFQSWKIFEMPLPGYLGFLPFALECYVMYVSVAGFLNLPSPQCERTISVHQDPSDLDM